jgi:hypothetical protein
MGKNWIKPVGIVVGLCLVVLLGARVLLGLMVSSSEFRNVTSRLLERGLSQVIPGVMVELDSIELSGMTRINLANLLVRSGHKADVTVIAPLVTITPRLGPFLKSSLVVLDINATLPEGGHLQTQVAAPFKWILGRQSKGDRYEPHLAMEGVLEGVSVPPLFAMMMAGEDRPKIQLIAGRATGRFAVRKPVGSTRVTGHKSGRIDLQILSPRWAIATPDGSRELKPANLDVSLELQDFAVVLRQPLIFQDRSERAVITGSLLLPKYAEEDQAWDLIVQSEGSPRLELGLARLLRCRSLPAKPTFTVKGRLSGPRCQS